DSDCQENCRKSVVPFPPKNELDIAVLLGRSGPCTRGELAWHRKPRIHSAPRRKHGNPCCGNKRLTLAHSSYGWGKIGRFRRDVSPGQWPNRFLPRARLASLLRGL